MTMGPGDTAMLVEGGRKLLGCWEKGVIPYPWDLGDVAPEVTLTDEWYLGTGVCVRIPEAKVCCK